MYHVGISGSYGGMNLGDEAILSGIITQLRKSVPVDITVFSRNPEDTKRRHKVERSVPVRELTRTEVTPEVKRLDLLILGGGGILYDADARTYLREVEIAEEAGVPVMIYAVGVGPLIDPNNQRIVREVICNATVITVRERTDQKILEDIGVKCPVIVTADPGLLMEPEPLPENTLIKERMDSGQKLVAMSIREPGPAAPDIEARHYRSLLANTADYLVNRHDVEIIFVPMERNYLDVQYSHSVVSEMMRPQRASVLSGDYTSGQVLNLMGHFNFAVGMRLHFLIFAAIQRVPFVPLPYASKVTGFINILNIDLPPLSKINAGKLIAYVDQSWDDQNVIRKRLEGMIPPLQKQALENNRIAVELLKEKAAVKAA